MEPATMLLLHSTSLPTHPFSSKLLHPKRGFISHKRASTKISVSKRDAYDRDYDGKYVDESMIVLKRRIHEMKIAERIHEAPSNWMEWEKRYYAKYNSDIFEAVGLLQTLLMNTRPSLAFGMVALIALSVPVSVAVIVLHLVEIAEWLLARILLS